MKKFGTQICLVSGQPDANLLPVLDKALRPSRVILLATPQMEKAARNLQAAIQDYVKAEIFMLDSAYDMRRMGEQLTDLEEKAGFDLEDVVVNITGGTKPMSIAAFRWCLAFGVPCFYMSVADSTLTLFSGEKMQDTEMHEVQVDDSSKLLSRYFQAHGFELLKTRETLKQTAERQEFIEHLMKKSRAEEVGQLNNLASDAADAYRQRARSVVAVPAPAAVAGSAFFQWLSQLGLVEVRGCEAVFSGDSWQEAEENIRFLNGIWFEEAVANALREAFPGVAIHQDVEVKNRNGQGTKNEFDAVFFYKNQLCIVEVKTKKFEEGDNNSQDVLHKLDAMTQKAGGLAAKKCLVSYRPLPSGLRARAQENGVCVIQGSELFPHPAFVKRLQKWLA